MSLTVSFVPREQPLMPVAAAAAGPAARGLGERLARLGDDHLSSLRGLSGPDLLLVIGDRDSLPWAPEIVYLGRDPEAPRLLVPTALRPDIPVDLFERAILARARGAPAPLAVLPSPRRIVKAALVRRIERSMLEGWLSRWPP
jgi:hypothetical protein